MTESDTARLTKSATIGFEGELRIKDGLKLKLILEGRFLQLGPQNDSQ